jgi:hypothetical protein
MELVGWLVGWLVSRSTSLSSPHDRLSQCPMFFLKAAVVKT